MDVFEVVLVDVFSGVVRHVLGAVFWDDFGDDFGRAFLEDDVFAGVCGEVSWEDVFRMRWLC